MASSPPRLAQWLLHHTINPYIRYGALGDFEELYAEKARLHGTAVAAAWYWKQALLSLFPFLLDATRWSLVMLRNYILLVLRNARRYKGYTALNLTGLAVGLACCLLIVLYVRDELSYDRYHTKADSLFRVHITFGEGDASTKLAMLGMPVGRDLHATYPEIRNYTRFIRDASLLQHPDQPALLFQEENGLYADSSALSMFSFPMVHGDPNTALSAPFSIVLTASKAHRYFGDVNPIGQTLLADSEHTLTVTGVLADIPSNSHFTFDYLLSMATLEQTAPSLVDEWWALIFTTFVELADPATYPVVETKMAEYAAPFQDDETRFTLSLGSLTDLYLRTEHRSDFSNTGSLQTIYVFSGIAVLILLLACINFMNLSTARSGDRAKEIGVRKVMGAQRHQVAQQFLAESLLTTLFAFGLALGLTWLALPAFNAFAGKSLTLASLLVPAFMIPASLIILLIGLLAGLYPALVLSHFQPISALKGILGSVRQGHVLRKSLVVFQFSLSIALVAGTLIVFAQLDYMQTKNLGFDKEQLLTINFRGDAAVRQQETALKTAFAQRSDITAISISGDIPGIGNRHAGLTIELADGTPVRGAWRFMNTDFAFLDTYGLDVVAGRGFSLDFPTDSTEAVLINEAAVVEMGLTDPEDALGLSVASPAGQGKIIGVLRDFHLKSLQQAVEPTYVVIGPNRYRYFTLRLQTTDARQTLSELEALWQTHIPHRPFAYTFVDERFDRLYRTEVQFRQVVTLFSGLALLVACLGLLGLASLSIRQRTKEIGIRKTMGASVHQLIWLLTQDFGRLVVIAFVLAIPLAYAGMNQWLDNFAYRVSLTHLPFLVAGLLAFGLAVITVSYQSLRAAQANPVDTLRYE